MACWKILGVALCFAFILPTETGAWGSSGGDRMLLTDVNTLTLYNGRMTSARRSSAVPQLKCVGGSAGCSSFAPQVVQCYNRGTDGVDVQWECKTDMDNAYRFGRVEVSCEGYDYAEDPYILSGSCGLEYTLDFTKEGYNQQNRQNEHREQHNYYQDDQHNVKQSSSYKKDSNWFGDIVLLVLVGVVIYAIYRTCIAPSLGQGTGGEDGTGGNRGQDQRRGPSAPPPPGFRDDYMPGSGGGCSSNFGGSTHSQPRTAAPGTGGGGFWTGMGAGGLLGYMFGSRTNQGYHHQRPHTGYGTGWGSGFGGGSRTYTSTPSFGSSFGGGGGGFSGGSSGTRTASGFGGTKRR